MMSTSGKLTLAAFTEITTSPGPGDGEASSSSTSDSGGPYCLQTTAFIAIECHMPMATTDDGVKLHYEETGAGTPIVFVHEFAGDLRSWEPQVRHFGRRYRCIAYNARGYPPSEVPEDVSRYSQSRARDDILAMLDALKLERAHIVGLSMGAFATLHFGMAHGSRALSLTVAGGGYGAHPAQYARFQADSRANAEFIRREGMAKFAATYGHGPTRVQLQNKDPRGFAEYIRQLAEHSALGSANTMAGYQARRPSLYELAEDMKRITTPTLIMAGDEEEPCLEVCLLMKRCIPNAGLAVLPWSGHAVNLEEPALFNRLLDDFLHQVEAGRPLRRDPRAAVPSIYGPGGKP
jgi:pimeloyl-ACP methyl ester carboxylesterase